MISNLYNIEHMNTKLTSEKIIKTSKFLSYILRHKPETIDITLD